MKSKKQIIKELLESGISIIDNYFNEEYCKKAISEIDDLLISENDKVHSLKDEGASGDYRLFKIENKSKCAKRFQGDEFINSILNTVSKKKIESYFILGGKLTFKENEIKNSGGGWHRDSDLEQFKAMVYLDDVNKSNGPFMFLQNSDQFDLDRRAYSGKISFISRIYVLLGKLKKNPPRYTDLTVKNYRKKSNTKPLEVIGKKGTLVLFNSTYLHRGKNIEEGTRYTFTNYMFSSNLLSKYSKKKQFQKLFIK